MRIAFDIHGVIDTLDLSKLAKKLYDEGHIIYILTSMHWSDEAEAYLLEYGFKKDFNFSLYISVADYHKELGTKIHYDERGRPRLDPETWNATKGQICYDYFIDALVDDSNVYAKYFDSDHPTMYIKFNKDTILKDIDDLLEMHMTKEPYIEIKKVVYLIKWNANYDQDAICTCGHDYKGHFNKYEGMAPDGCAKCQCGTFKLKQ
jgi:hypothetical protein